jgi:dnd system-associated protein 4
MSDTAARGSGRVNIDGSLHDLYKQLSEGSNPENAPFRTMKDVFMLAAYLGYRRGQPKPIAGSKRQIFHYTQFSDQVDMPILKAIAIATTGDIQVLADPEQIVQIAEEYANAGIQELKAQIVDQIGQPLWNLVELVRSP